MSTGAEKLKLKLELCAMPYSVLLSLPTTDILLLEFTESWCWNREALKKRNGAAMAGT